MGFVRATRDVFLAQQFGGFRRQNEEFDYDGPENEYLVPADKQAYYNYSVDQLKAEITRRNLTMPPPQRNGMHDAKELNAILVTHDAEQPLQIVEPQEVVKAEDGSSSDKYGVSDWTAAGMDKDGFPVPKDDASDVTKKKAAQR